MLPAPHRAVVLVSALSAVIGLTACSSSSSSGAGVKTVAVSLTDAGCDPAALRIAAGPTTFVVTNQGADAVTEFEIVKDGTIVGEVENVAPGLERSFSLNVDAGTYETRCPGGTDAATGTLTATGAAASNTGAAPALVDAAVAAYRTTDGIDPVTGQLDAGLFFICFQRDPRTQFVPLQQRLASFDALNAYIKHVGSGIFAVPPGAQPGGFVGETQFA